MKISDCKMAAIKALIECDMPYTLQFGLHDRLERRDEQIRKQAASIDGLIKNNACMKERNLEYLDTIKGLEAELSARKEDSEVLAKVVTIARQWKAHVMASDSVAMTRISRMVNDYLDATEVPNEVPDEPEETVICVYLELP